jgi:hypothetical protein
VAYDIEETIRAYADLALEPEIEEVLFKILRTGGHSSPVNEKVQG